MSAAALPPSVLEGWTKVTWTRTSDGSEVPGYAAGTPGKAALIVLQEWWGVERDVLHTGRKLAAAGFYVLVPDLYRGKIGVNAEEAHHLMGALDWPGAVADIAGAAKHLKANGAARVGVTGFCMGGALSLAAGVRVPDVDAVAPFYGIPQPALADPAACTKPVQGHFGGLDGHKGFSDPAAVDALETKLKASGCEYELHRYPSVGHAFMNETPEGIVRKKEGGNGDHDAAAVALAMERLVAFFRKHLAA